MDKLRFDVELLIFTDKVLAIYAISGSDRHCSQVLVRYIICPTDGVNDGTDTMLYNANRKSSYKQFRFV